MDYLKKRLQSDFTYDNRVKISEIYEDHSPEADEYLEKWFSYSKGRYTGDTARRKLECLYYNDALEETVLLCLQHRGYSLVRNDPYHEYICESRNLSKDRSDFINPHNGLKFDMKVVRDDLCAPNHGQEWTHLNPKNFHDAVALIVVNESMTHIWLVDAATRCTLREI